jgi:ABC-2 type transport system ATP-binding protein
LIFLDDLDRQAIPVEELSVHTPDLDDVFMALTGSDGRQEDPR